MKNSKVGKIIRVIAVISITIEIGIATAYFMLVNIDFGKYRNDYVINVVE